MNLKAIFREGETSRTIPGLTQWDYGRKLEITHPDLPAVLEVHFAVVGTLEAIVRAVSGVNGTAVAVIPDELLRQARPIMAWAYIVSETGGETMLTVTMPVRARAKPAGAPTLPEDMSDKYTEALEAINVHAGRRDNPHGIAAAQIGAAPAGFGLGTTAKLLTSADDLNTIWQSGWYHWRESAPKNAPVVMYDANYGRMFVDGTDANQFTQTVMSKYSPAKGKSVTRDVVNGDTDGWEWVNPPMQVGVEYRTTERWQEKPVYTKLINCGKCANEKTVQTGHGTIFRHSGNLNMNHSLPFSVSNYQGDFWAESRNAGASLILVCGPGFEGDYTWYEQIWWIER